MATTLTEKRLEVLHELVPLVTLMAVLMNPTSTKSDNRN